jgi:hypothetical protein
VKQKVGPAGIVVGLCALAILMFVLYRVFLPAPSAPPAGETFKRPGYGPPSGNSGAPSSNGPAGGSGASRFGYSPPGGGPAASPPAAGSHP